MLVTYYKIHTIIFFIITLPLTGETEGREMGGFHKTPSHHHLGPLCDERDWDLKRIANEK